MPSFDVVSQVDMHEVANAVDQANREVANRFDFKGTEAKFVQSDENVTLEAKEEFQLGQMLDIFHTKLAKRGIDIAALESGEPVVHMSRATQLVKIRQGIDAELAKKVVKHIKGLKIKVQAAIQGDQIRVTGKKRDDLQAVIASLGDLNLGLPLQYLNFRD